MLLLLLLLFALVSNRALKPPFVLVRRLIAEPSLARNDVLHLITFHVGIKPCCESEAKTQGITSGTHSGFIEQRL